MSQSTKSPAPLTPANWFGKVAAAVVLGFPLSVGLSGLLAYFGPGGVEAYAVDQIAMWSVAFFWCPILAACFLFRDSLRAWLWLGGATVLTYALLFGGRALFY
ncbi:MAG: hypothetical protein Q7P63_13145 [Verrucomicrobiota bacterium JB022]|nr:hypothetical protein [Verrucomicrobiota bacterium JB022]